MKIYTKTGDSGTTTIVGGTRLSKADTRIEVYGTIDELNAQIGLALNYVENPEDKQNLNKIQQDLFKVGSIYCTDWSKFDGSKYIIKDEDIIELEEQIDIIDKTLPDLKEFIMPGGSLAASHLHVARTVCRRAERLAVGYHEGISISFELPNDMANAILQPQSAKKENPELPTYLLQGIRYLNRLSDYLFVLARKNA